MRRGNLCSGSIPSPCKCECLCSVSVCAVYVWMCVWVCNWGMKLPKRMLLDWLHWGSNVTSGCHLRTTYTAGENSSSYNGLPYRSLLVGIGTTVVASGTTGLYWSRAIFKAVVDVHLFLHWGDATYPRKMARFAGRMHMRVGKVTENIYHSTRCTRSRIQIEVNFDRYCADYDHQNQLELSECLLTKGYWNLIRSFSAASSIENEGTWFTLNESTSYHCCTELHALNEVQATLNTNTIITEPKFL